MTKIDSVRGIFEERLSEISNNSNEWKNTINELSKMYKINFCMAFLANAQNKSADIIAPISAWNKQGRKVHRGAKGIAVFKDVDNIEIQYLFDIKQTYGKEINPRWTLDDQYINSALKSLTGSDEINFNVLASYFKKTIAISYTEVYNQIIDKSPNFSINVKQFQTFIHKTALQICMARCGFDTNIDFEGIGKVIPPKYLMLVGECARQAAYQCLRNVELTASEIKKRGIDYGRENQRGVLGEERSNAPEVVGRKEQQLSSTIRRNGTAENEGNGLNGAVDTEHIGSDHKAVSADRRTDEGQENGDVGKLKENQYAQRGLDGASGAVDGNGYRSGERNVSVDGAKNQSTDRIHQHNGLQATSDSNNLITDKGATYVAPYIFPYKIGEEYNYEGRKLEINNINYVNETIELIDKNTGWYPLFTNVSFSFALSSEAYSEYINHSAESKEVPEILQDEIIQEIKSEKVEEIVDKAIKAVAVKTAIDSSIYSMINELAPQILTGEYEYMKLTSGDYDEETGGFEPFSIEWVSDDRISIMHHYIQNGDLMRDPDIELLIDNTNKTATAVSYQLDSMGIYQEVYDEAGRANKVLQESINKSAYDVLLSVKQNEYSLSEAIQNGERISFEEITPNPNEVADTIKLKIHKTDDEIIETVLLTGSGFVDGKYRINEFGKTTQDNKAFADFLKKEYGIGGQSGRSDDIKGFDFDGKGLQIALRELTADGTDNRKINLTWNNVASRISELIQSENYFTEEDIKNRIAHAKWDYKEHIGATTDGERNQFEKAKAILEQYNVNADTEEIEPQGETSTIRLKTVSNPNSSYYVLKDVRQAIWELGEGIAADGVANGGYDWNNYIEAFKSVLLGNWENDKIPQYLQESGVENILQKAMCENSDLLEDKEFKHAINELDYVMNTYRQALRGTVIASEIQPSAEMDQLSIENLVNQNDNVASAETGKEPVQAREDIIISNGIEVAPIIKPKTQAQNYHYEETDNLYPKGAKEKFRNNVNAIKMLHKLETERRPATRDEQVVMAKYVGWGGLSKAFDESADDWHSEYVELKSLLSNDEYESAAESTLTAYYTEPAIIKQMYKALEQFGFDGGYVLEPAMGNGNFFANMPLEMAKNSHLYGIELDKLTGRMAQLLYPNADIQVKGYELTDFENDKFDVVIGNVPFGNYGVFDSNYDSKLKIHDYYFVKSLDKLKAGGIMAFISSKGTLEKADDTARVQMAQKAKIIGACRLPNNAFKSLAGTEVTTDIIFMQKRTEEISLDEARKEEFVRLQHWTSFVNGKREYITANGYYQNRMDNMLGNWSWVSSRFGYDYECLPKEGQKLDEQLSTVISTFSAQFSAEKTVEKEIDNLNEETDKEKIKAEDGMQDSTYIIKNDKLYLCNGGYLDEMQLSATADKRVKGICDICDKLQTVINIQLEPYNHDDLQNAQKTLNDVYDSFVKKYGFLNSPTNLRAFNDDVRLPLISSVENEDKENNGFKKADIFTEATIRPQEEITQVNTADDALIASLNTRLSVDLPYMASIYDKEMDDIITELKGKIYLNPIKHFGNIYDGWETAEEYLSGNVRDKLGVALAKAEENPELFLENVEALRNVQPEDVPITSIEFGIGATFVPLQMYNQFMWEQFETKKQYRQDISTRYNPNSVEIIYIKELDQYKVTNKSSEYDSVMVNETFGTKRINAYAIMEQTLNQATVTVSDPESYITSSGNEATRYKVNIAETTLAREKQAQIKKAFKDWVIADPQRISTIETIYNNTFNSITPRKYDGSHLRFKGLAADCALHQHQLDGAARIIYNGTAMIPHKVGAGKTATMIAAGMYMKNVGAIQKAMYVVPNAIVAQWGREFLRFFPSAKVLVTTSKDFEKNNRRRFLSKITTGNYDAIIISHSQFAMIPLSKERQIDMLREKISNITTAAEIAAQEEGGRFTVKDLQSMKKRLTTRLTALLDKSAKDDFMDFEKLGVDMLFVDEAHKYKNLYIATKMTRVAGVNNSYSGVAEDMENKVRYIQEQNNGRGIVFATGTPISNSVCEMYVMQHYLQPNTLHKMNIDSFDKWASTFGKTTTALEVKPSGTGYRMKTRFANFHNIPELVNISAEVFDYLPEDKIPLKVPEIVGGKPEIIICQKSPAQEEQIEIGLERALAIENKLVKPDEDNMLAVCTYMTKVALDGRIIDNTSESYPMSKVNVCADEVKKIYDNHNDMAQTVFCDTSTPKNDGTFDVYNGLKQALIERGFKPEQIAFIHEATNETKKTEMFERVKSADIKVIVGSTEKLGTGVNMQDRLIALHHLDAPYRPSDLEQRNGRGIRRGNVNEQVHIKYYSTKGTFDSYRWQLLEKKQHFISQIMSGKILSRSCEDIDEATLNFAEMKAATQDNPLIAEKMNVDNEVQRLTLLQNAYTTARVRLTKDIDNNYPKEISRLNQIIEKIKLDIATTDKNKFLTDEDWNITIAGQKIIDRSKANEIIEGIVKSFTFSDEKPLSIGNFRGLETYAEKENGSANICVKVKGNCVYSGALSGYSRIANRIDGIVAGLPDRLIQTESQLTNTKKQMENAKLELAKPFEHTDELTELLSRQSKINSQLEFGNEKQEVGDIVSETDEMEM